jgi:TonB family protein
MNDIAIYVGLTAHKVIEKQSYEKTELIFPTTPPPPLKLRMPTLPKVDPPKARDIKLNAPKIVMPKVEPKPDPKPVELQAKVELPKVNTPHPSVVLAPQPRAALASAAPAQTTQTKPSTAMVHLGDTFGVTPNPNATRPATVAAIGNPHGGLTGEVGAPRGVVGSTGIGDRTQIGSGFGSGGGAGGRVASAGLPSVTASGPVIAQAAAIPASTNLEILSKPQVQYTAEARRMSIQGDVILKVTFTAAGQVRVLGVVHGLGHGLDEEARREAQQIRFRPATKDGKQLDLTTNVTITFQLA